MTAGNGYVAAARVLRGLFTAALASGPFDEGIFHMSHRSPVLRFATVLAAGLFAASGLAACANNSAKEATAPTASVSVGGKDAALAAKVPQAIASKGTLTVGTDASYAPNEYEQNGKIVGFDIDLFNAVAAKLGLKASYQNSKFDNIIPGITGGKYDIGVSSFTDSAPREQIVDFVTYFSAGTEWATQTGKTVDPNNACGLKVAVQTATVQDTTDLPARQQQCAAAGKPAISVQKYEAQSDATTAVVLGKADAMLADSPVTAYAIKQSGGKLVAAGSVYDAAPYGYAVAKTAGTFKDALQGAVNALIGDGTYGKILAKWGLEAGAVTTSKINAASGG